MLGIGTLSGIRGLRRRAKAPGGATAAVRAVRLRSAAGRQVKARLYAADGAERAVVLIGMGPAGSERKLAQALQAQGYLVLWLDSRAAAPDDPPGRAEAEDVLGAIDFLNAACGFSPGQIGLLGLSVGAVAAILAAGRRTDIGAVVSDSAFAVLYPQLAAQLGGHASLGARLRRRLRDLRWRETLPWTGPLDTIAQMMPRPLLVIHGLADHRVPPRESEYLFDYARGHKSVWFVPEAGHAGAFLARPEEYIRRLDRFFGRYLAPRAMPA